MHLGRQRECEEGINLQVAELTLHLTNEMHLHLYITASPLDILHKLYHHSNSSRRAVIMVLTTVSISTESASRITPSIQLDLRHSRR